MGSGADDPRVVRSKAAVLASAAELLAESGMNGATVDAVAARSGVAKTTIYRHWPDRDALLLDAVFAMAPPSEDPSSGDLRRDLVEVLSALASTLYDSDFGRTLPSLIDNASRDEDAARLLAQFGHERRRAVCRILHTAVGEGELPAGSDVKLLHSLLAGPVFYEWLAGGRSRPSRRHLGQIVEQVLAGARAAV